MSRIEYRKSLILFQLATRLSPIGQYNILCNLVHSLAVKVIMGLL